MSWTKKKSTRCAQFGTYHEVKVDSATDGGVYYLVAVPPWVQGDPRQAICECISYNMRGWCHHQKDALDLICDWVAPVGDDTYTECPECGGEIEEYYRKEYENTRHR